MTGRIRPLANEDCVVDIFDEVEAELKAERAQKLLVNYGVWLLVAALLVVGGAGAWQVWSWYQARYDRATAAIYLNAMFAAEAPGNIGNTPGTTIAAADFARVIHRGPAAYRTLARLQQAALEAKQGHEAGAVAMWNAVAEDGGADPLLRNLAVLLWTEHQLATGNPQILRERLTPLLAPGNPWRPLAREAAALLDIRLGQKVAAKKELETLAMDITAPLGLRERAGALLQRLNG